MAYLDKDGTSRLWSKVKALFNKGVTGISVSGRTITITKGDGSTSTQTTQDTTYSNFKGATASADGGNGLVPAPTKGNEGKYLKADGTWGTPANTTYNVVSKTAPGLAPQLPNETSTSKYLRQDGTWVTPPNTTYSDATQTTHGLMSTTDKKKLDDISAGAESNQPAYTYIDVDGGSGGTMGALEKEDTLNIKSGANVKVEVVTSSDGHDGNDGHSLKISATDTTYGLFERGTPKKNPVNGLAPGPMYDMTDRAFLTVLGWEEFDLSAWCKADSVSIAQMWSDEYAELCQIPGATQEKAGVMMAADKKKLDEIDVDALKKELKAYIDQSSTSFNIDKVYPIGSIYTSVNDTDPSTLFGGTWVRFGQGRTLVGVNSADDDFGKAEQTGGEKTHTLDFEEMPEHNHRITIDNKELTGSVWNFTGQNATYGPGNSTSGVFSKGGDGTCFYPSATGKATGISDGFTLDASHTHTATASYEGGGEAHNNMPPYITVYMWKRTK